MTRIPIVVLAFLLLAGVLIALTLFAIGIAILFSLVRDSLLLNPAQAYDRRVRCTRRAASLSRLSLLCGPLTGFILALLAMVLSCLGAVAEGQNFPSLRELGGGLILLLGLGLLAGLVAATTFWAVSLALAWTGRSSKSVPASWTLELNE